MTSRNLNKTRIGAAAFLLLLAVAAPQLFRTTASDRTLVLYCAHDAIFADQILREFETQTGIHVQVRYDEEASKSLGLTNLLIAEKDKPRCDVFWNNQTLGTIRLKEAGVLAACPEDVFHRIPREFRDPDNCWAGFAARLRVWIVNTTVTEPIEEAVRQTLNAESLTRVAIAVPLYGTTLTHYCMLADEQGLDGLQAWHESLHRRHIREARGNGAVKDLVAEGVCDLGFTDTDDVFVAMDAGKPVEMLPARLPSGHTICIPNTVAMIHNCPHPDLAQELVRYLLSEPVELALAASTSRQIPLGSVDESRLSPEVLQLRRWATEAVSPSLAARSQKEVLAWLTRLYAQP